MTLRIAAAELSKVFVHARETYPEECCGFLIGVDGPRREVREVRRASNVHPDRRDIRYTVDPREQLMLEMALRGTDRVIVGFYHSHPDHPGVPSAFDVERSWPEYSYLVVEVRRGTPVSARSFRIDSERGIVAEEKVARIRPKRRGPPRAGRPHGKVKRAGRARVAKRARARLR